MPDYPQAEPIIRWKRHWEYAEWKEATLKGRYAGEELLQMLYSRQWEPEECNMYMQAANLFKKAPKPKKVKEPKPPDARRRVLTFPEAQKRIALAVWKECATLLGKSLAPDAKAFLQQSAENVKAIVFRNDVEKLADDA